MIQASIFFDITDVALYVTLSHNKFVFTRITFTCVQISTCQDLF